MKRSSLPNGKPIIRSAVAGEAEEVAECVRLAFFPYIERIGKPPAPMLADFPEIIRDGKVWVAMIGEKIGGVLVQYETEEGFYVDTVAVVPHLQGTGIGRELLEFAEGQALKSGFHSIYLCTNVKMTKNQVLYPKIGYVEYERKFDQGYERIFYRKQLS